MSCAAPGVDPCGPSVEAHAATEAVAAKTPGWLISQILLEPDAVSIPYETTPPHTVALAHARTGRWADAAAAHDDAASLSETTARYARNRMVPLSDETVRAHDSAAQLHRMAAGHCRSMCS